MTKEQKPEAVSIFKNLNTEVLYLNNRGNFFTSENLALNSVERAEDLTTLHRDKVLTTKKSDQKSGNQESADVR